MKLNQRMIFFSLLYIVGLTHWLLFLNYGSPGYIHEDWAFFHQMYAVYKQAVDQSIVPYYATLFAADTLDKTIYDSSRFLANSWTVFAPQMALMKFISVPAYITSQYLLFYTIMFFGLLKWVKKLDLSFYAAAFLIMVYSFNGKLISQTGFGWPQITFGHMLIPWLFWMVYELIECDRVSWHQNFRTALGLSLFFFIVLSQSDMHVYYQMVLAAGCVLLFYPKKMLWYIGAVFMSLIYSLWYIMPVIFFNTRVSSVLAPEGYWRRSGILGYGHENGHVGKGVFENIKDMPVWEAIPKYVVNILHHIWESLTRPFNAYYYNTHDYNLYIGYLGVLLVAGGVFVALIQYKPFTREHLGRYRFIFGIFIVMLLAIGPFNKGIISFFQSIRPFNPIDAIPSRLMIYPFCVLVLIAAANFDEMFRLFPVRTQNMIKGFTLVALGILLMTHSYDWWLFNSQVYSSGNWTPKIFNAVIYGNIVDPHYKVVVNYSYLSSIVFVSLAVMIYFINPKRSRE